MLRMHMFLPLGCALVIAEAVFALDAKPARACGGCFHEPPSGPSQVVATVVTDHRMAFSISPAQTVLWDQIVYSGNPAEFAWVLPVKPGARIELSQDAWIASLDASTQTVITGPTPFCGGVAPTEYSGGGGSGCGFGATSDSASAAGFESPAADAGSSPPPVTVVSQSVVGPYDEVTVRSSQGEALGTWLRGNGYDVPLTIQPTIDAFTTQGFDFIALKLRPGEGVQAMQPVRVVTAGADPSLPLRMVAAGVGAYVGIELYVLSEGRYHPQNFPDVAIDFSKLAWDPTQNRSNYTQLAQAALAAGDGTGWLTESAQPASLYGSGGPNPGLSSTYSSTCLAQLPAFGCAAFGVKMAPLPGEGGVGGEAGSNDAASSDGSSDSGAGDDVVASEAGDDGAAGNEAGGDDGGGSEAGGCGMQTATCDDLTLAMTGIATGNLWITRLRAKLPVAALANDLVIEAAASQDPVSNLHTTNIYTDPSYSPCPSSNGTPTGPASSSHGSCACRTVDTPRTRYGESVALLAGAVAIAFGLRRRRVR
jgi:hypothetical protein